jgi:hypothetical protein
MIIGDDILATELQVGNAAQGRSGGFRNMQKKDKG